MKGNRPIVTQAVSLFEIAYARSGDKGSSANIGVIAYTSKGFDFLKKMLSAKKVETYFKSLGVGKVIRYELPNLWALNFILPKILAGGGSNSLRIDAQGKALGQALLEIPLQIPAIILNSCRPKKK